MTMTTISTEQLEQQEHATEAVSENAAPATTAKKPRRFSRRQIGAAIGLVVALILTGGTAAALTVSHLNAVAAAAESERAAKALEAERAEAAALQLYSSALTASQAEARVLVDDAAALAASGSALLTANDLAALQSIVDELADAAETPLPAGSDSLDIRDAFRELDKSVASARAAYAPVVANAAAAAQAAYDGYTMADAGALKSLADAKAAFASAAANKLPSAEAFTALTAAVSAAGASHQAAADLAAAAAEAAKSGKKTYTHNGQTYYTGTVTPVVPGTTTPPSTGTPSTPGGPALDAGAKAASLASSYGGSTSVAGACAALNYGYVTPNGSFGPNATYDGYYSAVKVTVSSNPSYPNHYYVQWYACPN